MPSATVEYPASNGPDVGYVGSDSLLIYTLDDPLDHPVTCVSCSPNQKPFTNFHVGFFLVRLSRHGATLHVSQPRPLFKGPKGINIALYAAQSGWLVYAEYRSADVMKGTFWKLVARNLNTGKQLLLDSPQMEHLPSVPGGATSDGKTVVWGAWTASPNGGKSVVYSYNLRTGKRSVLLEGGSPHTWGYSRPVVSGNLIVVERDAYGHGPGDVAHQSSRIIILNRISRVHRTLTPPHAFRSEPYISGNLAVWKNGSTGSQGSSITVDNLKTGKRTVLHGTNIESPKVVEGRYVVYPSDGPGSGTELRAYDVKTGSRFTLFKESSHWGGGLYTKASDHTVIYQKARKGPDPRKSYGGDFVATRLP